MNKRNLIISLSLSIAAILIGLVVIVGSIAKATERKIQASQAQIEANNKRLLQLDGVLEAYSKELTKLQKHAHQIDQQLDSTIQKNQLLTNSLNLQRLKTSKLKQQLYNERNKTNFSDSTANSIIQGFSE